MAEQSGAVLAEAIGLETRDGKAIVRVRNVSKHGSQHDK